MKGRSFVPEKVLVVDDEPGIVAFVSEFMVNSGYEVGGSPDPQASIALFESFRPDVCVVDLRMPYILGSELMCRFRQIDPTVEIIFVTAQDDMPLAIDLMKRGASDYLVKPMDLYQLSASVDRALEHRRLIKENADYKLRIERMLAEETEAHRVLRHLFGRYVSEEVAAQLAAEPSRHLKPEGEKREVTVLFADVRGFTSLAETIDPMRAVEILNVCLSHVVDAVFEFGGTVDKFLGDGIMALFGAPIEHADDPYRAVCCALRIREKIESLRFGQLNHAGLHMGLGINTGVVIAGTIGSERRMDYTVIGDPVNVAQRLESIAGPAQILMTDTTYERVKDRVNVSKLGEVRLKGKSEPVTAFELLRCPALESFVPPTC